MVRARDDLRGPRRIPGRAGAGALGGLRLRETGFATTLDLYARGAATLLASWEEDARGLDHAALVRLDGAAAAVFPSGPERSVYNNALLERGLGPRERAAAVAGVAAAYDSAGVDRFAVWVHETDEPMREELSGRGYGVDETTMAMGTSLDRAPAPPADVEVEALAWPEYLEFLWSSGAPRVLTRADPEAYSALGVRLEGRTVSAAIAFDHDGDCGIYNMGTLEPFRRRGLGGAVLAAHLHDAVDRGCSTASLQSTPMAEGVYSAGGFQRLGRFLEFGPMARAADA